MTESHYPSSLNVNTLMLKQFNRFTIQTNPLTAESQPLKQHTTHWWNKDPTVPATHFPTYLAPRQTTMCKDKLCLSLYGHEFALGGQLWSCEDIKPLPLIFETVQAFSLWSYQRGRGVTHATNRCHLGSPYSAQQGFAMAGKAHMIKISHITPSQTNQRTFIEFQW